MDATAKQDRLEDALAGAGGPFGRPTVRWVAECGSTNTVLGEELRSGSMAGGPNDPGWQILIADRQTAGKGRLGRVWEAPVDASLAMSLALPVPMQVASLLPLATGVAGLLTAFELGADQRRLELKWPNDLMDSLTGRKLAGILCEAGTPVVGSEASLLWVVVGIGVNLMRPAHPEGTAAERAVWLDEVGGDGSDVVAVAAHLSQSIAKHAAMLHTEPAAVLELVRTWCATIGRVVRIEQINETFQARAVGVDDSGALIVRRSVSSPDELVNAGDVVHLRQLPSSG